MAGRLSLARTFQIFLGLWAAADKLSDTAGEFAPGKEHTPSARFTQQADVGAHANDFPAVAPARMGFAHLDQIARIEFLVYGEHVLWVS